MISRVIQYLRNIVRVNRHRRQRPLPIRSSYYRQLTVRRASYTDINNKQIR
ncbi:hypothetical protein F442_10338 [Phytophthora nicotianae P10297]|uniref:Uncharacterized protein n=2 Tax=Phytophthora nicotianae TaxID=4792 RepID=W2Z6U6_PHYNI|nr:hypothetical protein F444_10533 [Phytophthora nicotianae P1976]ETP42775.1 hypothetical protein F442_10338 [Phytophthora nicotianae P10297]